MLRLRGVRVPLAARRPAPQPRRRLAAAAAADKVTVHFRFKKTGEVKTVEAAVGDNVLRLAQRHDIPLEGACEGVVACSTCHCILDDDLFNALEPPSEDEEDMLDQAFGLTATSRLGCQLTVDKSYQGTTFTLPEATRNFYVDGHVPKPH